MRLQIALPSQIDLRGLTAQRFRPVRSRRVDAPATIAAELARQAHQHPFLFAVLGRLPGRIDEGAPVVVGNMMVDQCFSSFPALLSGETARLVVVVRLAAPEIGDAQGFLASRAAANRRATKSRGIESEGRTGQRQVKGTS